MNKSVLLKPNIVVQALTVELRRKGLDYESETMTIVLKTDNQEIPVLEFHGIVMKEALFLAKVDESRLSQIFEIQDLLRIKSLLEEIYLQPIRQILVSVDSSDLDKYKSDLTESQERKQLLDRMAIELFGEVK